MAVGTVSPVGIQQFFDANGKPLAGGQLAFYLAGTSTPSPAYADINLLTPLSNPVILDAAGRAPELFLDALSYKEILSTALGVPIWSADNIITPGAARSGFGTINLSGNQNDVPVPPGVVSFIDFRNADPLTITGFSGGTPGQVLILRAFGAANVTLPHISPASQSGNQLFNFVASVPTTLVGSGAIGSGGSAMYVRAGGWWLLITHVQGGWIHVPYSALTFESLDGLHKWTVDAADLKQFDYQLNGNLVLLTFAVLDTVLAAGTNIGLRIGGLPFTFRTAAGYLPLILGQGTPPWRGGVAVAQANTNVIDLSLADFTTISPGGVFVNFQGTVDIL